MSATHRYEINDAAVAHETIDGEVIAVHLRTGCYFALSKVGAEVWDHLGSGATAEAIAGWIAARHGRPCGEVEADVERFLAELARLDLVLPSEGVDDAPAATA